MAGSLASGAGLAITKGNGLELSQVLDWVHKVVDDAAQIPQDLAEPQRVAT